MRNPISIFIAAVGPLGVALTFLAASAGELVDRPLEPFYFYCRSNNLMGNTFYFSTTQNSDAGVTRQDLEKSFNGFLGTKHKYPNAGGVSCVFALGSDLQARTESNRQETINNLHSANYDVVVTDWTYRK